MATAVSQHTRHLSRHLGFFKIFIFSKVAANFLEIGRKHVLLALNRSIIKNNVEKKKLEHILSKRYSLFFN